MTEKKKRKIRKKSKWSEKNRKEQTYICSTGFTLFQDFTISEKKLISGKNVKKIFCFYLGTTIFSFTNNGFWKVLAIVAVTKQNKSFLIKKMAKKRNCEKNIQVSSVKGRNFIVTINIFFFKLERSLCLFSCRRF